MKTQFFPLALGGLLFATATACSRSEAGETVHWSYEGDTGPEHWGDLKVEWKLAATGRSQSPVDLANAENADVADLVVDYKAAPLVIVNNGHAIQVDCANGSSITVGEERYDLQQFHFHGPSEHTVNGKYAPMEAHFVHKNSLGQLAVIGVLIEEGPEHTELTEIWNEMPKSKGPARTVASVQVDPAALLPKDRISFRYSGSLTTPPCFEDVRWIVMQAPIRVSKEQVTAFRKVIGRNNRPVQPLHGRTERLGR